MTTTTIQLNKLYQHKTDQKASAVPFVIDEEGVGFTYCNDGILDTCSLSVEEFLKRFELDESKPD